MLNKSLFFSRLQYIATGAALKYLDTDGSALEIAGAVMHTKGDSRFA